MPIWDSAFRTKTSCKRKVYTVYTDSWGLQKAGIAQLATAANSGLAGGSVTNSCSSLLKIGAGLSVCWPWLRATGEDSSFGFGLDYTCNYEEGITRMPMFMTKTLTVWLTLVVDRLLATSSLAWFRKTDHYHYKALSTGTVQPAEFYHANGWKVT